VKPYSRCGYAKPWQRGIDPRHGNPIIMTLPKEEYLKSCSLGGKSSTKLRLERYKQDPKGTSAKASKAALARWDGRKVQRNRCRGCGNMRKLMSKLRGLCRTCYNWDRAERDGDHD
jgi:ribosomal protein S14